MRTIHREGRHSGVIGYSRVVVRNFGKRASAVRGIHDRTAIPLRIQIPVAQFVRRRDARQKFEADRRCASIDRLAGILIFLFVQKSLLDSIKSAVECTSRNKMTQRIVLLYLTIRKESTALLVAAELSCDVGSFPGVLAPVFIYNRLFCNVTSRP